MRKNIQKENSFKTYNNYYYHPNYYLHFRISSTRNLNVKSYFSFNCSSLNNEGILYFSYTSWWLENTITDTATMKLIERPENRNHPAATPAWLRDTFDVLMLHLSLAKAPVVLLRPLTNYFTSIKSTTVKTWRREGSGRIKNRKLSPLL